MSLEEIMKEYEMCYRHDREQTQMVLIKHMLNPQISYACNMIKWNRDALEALLPIEEVIKTDRLEYRYDISKLQHINDWLLKNTLNKEQVLKMIATLVDCFLILETYLLDGNHIACSFDYLFVDNTGAIKATYIPDETRFDAYADLKRFITVLISEKARISVDDTDNYTQKILEAVKDNRNDLVKLQTVLQECKRSKIQHKETKKQEEKVPPKQMPKAKSKPKPKPNKEVNKSPKKKQKETIRHAWQRFKSVPLGSNKRKSSNHETKNQQKDDIKIPKPLQKKKSSDTIKVVLPRFFTKTTTEEQPPSLPMDNGQTVVLPSEPQMEAVLSRDRDGKAFALADSPFTVGREETCDAVLSNPAVGKSHAVFMQMGRRWHIKDLRSVNGTYVNETRSEPMILTPIKDGDQIVLANETFHFKYQR